MSDEPDEVPVLRGYTVTWDGDGWVARSNSSGTFVLRGQDQNELNAERHRVYSAELMGMRSALSGVDPSGYRKADIPDP
jgi:hypothetical protein